MNQEGSVVQVCKLEGGEILTESAIKAAKLIKVSTIAVKRRLEANKRDYIEFTVTYTFKE